MEMSNYHASLQSYIFFAFFQPDSGRLYSNTLVIRLLRIINIVNQELVRLLFGYTEGQKVLSARKLRWMIEKHFPQGLEICETPNG